MWSLTLKWPSVAVACALLAACASVAGVIYPVSKDALEARPGDYVLDGDHATVLFSVDHLGFSTYYGRFNDLSGRLSLEIDDPSRSSVAVRIGAASIDTPSDELDEKLKSASMFDAAGYPDIVFESRSVARTGDNSATIEGALTIKGVTLPISLDAKFVGSGVTPLSNDRRAGFTATGKLSRKAFGLDQWSGFVGDEVALTISAEFIAG